MNLKKKIALVLAGAIALLLVVISLRPPTFHVERAETVKAPPEVVFREIDDFREWANWSPWEKLDPAMKKTFGGPPSGVGSTYEWAGNKDAGAGRMTIEKSEPGKRVEIKLEFLKPFEATNTATFVLEPVGDGTKVTWSMDGKNNFASKTMQLFFDMDKMVGGDFEKGLAGIRAISETKAAEPKK